MFSFRAAATAERFGSKRWSKADFCYWACGITSSRPAGRRIGDMNTNRPHSWNESCRHHRHLPPIDSHPRVRRPYQSALPLASFVAPEAVANNAMLGAKGDDGEDPAG
jgi:hypothetical protein